MKALRRMYLDGSDLERDGEAFMKFKLTYAGSLLSHKRLDTSGTDVRAWHKHEIRRHFHPQLKRFWEAHPFLSTQKLNEDGSYQRLQMGGPTMQISGYRTPMNEALCNKYQDDYGAFKYGWVPLAREEFALAVSLRIICLRRDGPNALTIGRDMDNRIKTLIDALALPTKSQGPPKTKEGVDLPPSKDEQPFFYVLLADDKLITHLEVETDTALDPNPDNEKDEDFVRLLISVEIRPYLVDPVNLNFA